MAEDINHLDFEPEDEEKPEPDPATVAFLDQEEQAWADDREQFKRVYGFDHACTCAQDYSSGKLGQVTECFLGLASDALDACAGLNYENKVLKAMLKEMIDINNGLINKMQEAGLGDEVQEFMNEETALQAESIDEEIEEGLNGPDLGGDEEDWEDEGGALA